jgi:hypothetical protein
MAQRRQRGWLKKESRSHNDTWVLFFRKTRKTDGKRVENKVPIGLVKNLPPRRVRYGLSRKAAPPYQVQRKGFVNLVKASMYLRSFRARSATEVKIPRLITSRWIFANGTPLCNGASAPI